MKYTLFLFFILCSSLFSFLACKEKDKSLKIGVISDIHFLSEQLMDDGVAINQYVSSGGKSIKDVLSVLDQVIQTYLDSDIKVLLIPGDLTKDGEKQSHKDLIVRLQPLIEKGIQIYVIPGNHDINMPNAVGYRGDQTYSVDNISPLEFESLYNKFGFDAAFSRDSSSLSYAVELDSDTWLVALDACKYNEYKDHSISSGRIKESTESWAVSVLHEAKNQKKRVIGMMHQGLVEHFPLQATLFKNYLVDDWQRLASLFADNGMQIIFTGHFHANDITEFVSNKGNKVYDIETGSLAAYPFPYRFVDVAEDKIDITTQNITSTTNNRSLAEASKNELFVQAKHRGASMLDKFGIQIPNQLKNKASDIGAQLFIKHLEGDEVMTDSLKNSIIELTRFFDEDKVEYIENLKLDFFPADNNVSIILNKD